MDQHTLTTVLTGLGVLVAMASYHRAEKKDRATQLENFEHRLDQKIDTRIDGLETRIDTRIDGLEIRLGGMEARLGGVETRLGGVETRLGGVETRLGGVETRLDGVETRLDGMDNRFGSLEERMDKGFAEMRAEHRSDMRDVRSYLHSLEQRFYEFLLPRRPAPTGTDDG